MSIYPIHSFSYYLSIPVPLHPRQDPPAFHNGFQRDRNRESLCFFEPNDIKRARMKEKSRSLHTIPRWERISFLVHGFGTRHWRLKDMRVYPELKNLKNLFLRQVHSDIIHVIDEIPKGQLTGDALITETPGVLLVIKTADCLPVLIVDKERKAVGAVHCGWKSTSRRLIQRVIQGLERHFKCDSSDIQVAMGPCIGKDCYEVGDDVRQEFRGNGLSLEVFLPHPLHTGKYSLDLKRANRFQLLDMGVRESNIFAVDLCTHCEDDLLSYRRNEKHTERMLSFIGLSF